MRLTYIPYMTHMLLSPLRRYVGGRLCVLCTACLVCRSGAEGVQEVIDLLHAYGLSRDDLMENMQELMFTLERDPVLRSKRSRCVADCVMCVCIHRLLRGAGPEGEGRPDQTVQSVRSLMSVLARVFMCVCVNRSQTATQALIYAQGVAAKKGKAKAVKADPVDGDEDYLGGEEELEVRGVQYVCVYI